MISEAEISNLVNAVRSILPRDQDVFPLHEPEFSGNEWDYVKSCLDDGWISSVGPFVDRFERDLADRCEVKHAIATVNGTAALHGSLMAMGVGDGDEVLVPALTFIATANAISYTGATPHFIDCEPRRLGVDVRKLASYLENIAVLDIEHTSRPIYRNRTTGRVLRAVVPMHVFGVPVDMEPLSELARHYGLGLVEDGAEALGSVYNGRPAGSLGDIAALSFNGNKIITTGGGGAILTNDDDLATRARHLCTTAKRPHVWEYKHDVIGFNYRMPNINAALGCAQLEQLDDRILRKREMLTLYKNALKNIHFAQMLDAPDGSISNCWLHAIILKSSTTIEERNAVLLAMHQAGVLCRPVWNLMHSLEMFKNHPRMDLSCSEEFERRIINTPSSAYLYEASEKRTYET